MSKPDWARISWRTVGAVAVVLAVGLILVAGARARSLGAASACAANLRDFVDGVSTHLHELSGGPFDTSAAAVQALLDAGFVNTDQIRCPTSGAAYVIVLPGAEPEERVDPRRIVAFEPLTDQHGEGGCVAYADGHVEFLPTEKYRAAAAGIERD